MKQQVVVWASVMVFLGVSANTFGTQWTKNTQAEFNMGTMSDIQGNEVAGQITLGFYDDFNDGNIDGWSYWSGDAGKVYATTIIGENVMCTYGTGGRISAYLTSCPQWTDYSVLATLRVSKDWGNQKRATIGMRSNNGSPWGTFNEADFEYANSLLALQSYLTAQTTTNVVTNPEEWLSWDVKADGSTITSALTSAYDGGTTYTVSSNDSTLTQGTFGLGANGGWVWWNDIKVITNTGTYTSETYEIPNGEALAAIEWSDVTPSQAGADAIRFQFATNNDNATWNFVGPDGTSDSYYSLGSGEDIWAGHAGDLYARYMIYMQTDDTDYAPAISSITVTTATIPEPATLGIILLGVTIFRSRRGN